MATNDFTLPIGSRFGLLTVVSDHCLHLSGRAAQLCRCDCGRELAVRREHLRSGNSTTCGCRGRFQYREATAERVRELFRYDPETGIFTRLVDSPMHRAKAGETSASINSQGYAQIRVDGKRYKAHRLAWLHMTGEWPTQQIDHIDGNRANNRWSNLREADQVLNMHNQDAPRTSNKIGIRGIYREARSGRYVASLRVNKQIVLFERFATATEAEAAYLTAKRLHMPEAC